MKRIFLTLAIILMATSVQAATISYTALSGDAGLSYTHLNNSFTTIYNDYNGNIDSDNIAAGSITSDDIATTANPLVRDYYNIGEYVYSGLTIATSASLSSTITAGYALVANDATTTLHLVITGNTAHTFTASKDTYVYLDFAGAFSYSEVANGATAPTTPSNSIAIAKVVTNGTAITTVTDLRSTTPSSLRVYTDYIAGCIISRDISDTDVINVGRGDIEFGSSNGKVRRNTSTIDIDFATTGRGGLDTGSQEGNVFYYLFLVADDGTDTAFEGIASLSSSDATGVTGERLVGWVYSPNTTILSPDSIGAYKGVNGSVTNMPYALVEDVEQSYTSGNLDTLLTLHFYTSGRPLVVYYSMNAATAGDCNQEICLSLDSAALPGSWVGFRGATGAAEFNGASATYPIRVGAGEHIIDFKYRADANQTIRNYKLIIEEK